MLRRRTAFALGLLALLALAAPARGQASPPASASCRFADGKTVTVEYSSPRVRGRTIFGGLVPYGAVWILGANEATSFVSTATVTVGGKRVSAGNYTLFAIPRSTGWMLIVNRTRREDIGRMSYYPGEDSDLVRVPMAVSALSSVVENFTISFVASGNSCPMRFEWEKTGASTTVQETP